MNTDKRREKVSLRGNKAAHSISYCKWINVPSLLFLFLCLLQQVVAMYSLLIHVSIEQVVLFIAVGCRDDSAMWFRLYVIRF